MDKLSDTARETLPEFQKFLVERKLVPEKRVPFFAYWVSRFLSFAKRRDLSAAEYQEALILEFLDGLQSDTRVLEWQSRQANEAIRLYYFHYLGKSAAQLSGGAVAEEVAGALAELKRLIRLKHYSYSTERTYLQWAERFLSYASGVGSKQLSDVTDEDFKDFLTHLALKRRVSSSTQNQAFNAVLFFFRHVLQKDPGSLGETVRAKRGPKLPVVLSVDEVKSIFSHMSGIYLLIAEMLYGSGLRLMELARLRVKDIDLNTKNDSGQAGMTIKKIARLRPENPSSISHRLVKALSDVCHDIFCNI